MPFLFGIEAYGNYVASAAVTLIIHRLTDLFIEPLIAERDPRRLISISVTSFAVSAIAALLLYQFDFAYRINLFLLAAMLSSTTVLNLVFQTGDTKSQLAYAVVFFVGFVITSALFLLSGSTNIVVIVCVVSFVGAVFGAVWLARCSPRLLVAPDARPQLHSKVADTFDRFCFSSLSVTLLFVAPLLAQGKISTAELGQLRVFTSLVYLGYWLTPVNPKHHFFQAEFLTTEHGIASLMRQSRWPLLGLLSGWTVAIFALRFYPDVLIHNGFIAALCVYPAGLCMSFFDKSALGYAGLRRTGRAGVIFTSAVIAALIWCKTIYWLEIAVMLAFVIYPTYLALLLNPKLMLFSVIPAAASVFGYVTIEAFDWPVVVATGLVPVAVSYLFFRRLKPNK